MLPFSQKLGDCRRISATCWIPTLVIAVIWGVPPQSYAIGGELNEELLQRAPAIIEYLNQQNYRNIGVLKFRVKRGDELSSDSVGELNSMIAERLELALVLKNPVRPDRQIGVIRDASSMAAMIGGANHLTPEGRVKLLNHSYPLAWSTERVTPDAMLTGLIVVSDDLATIKVGILAFDNRGGGIQRVIPNFEATASGITLGEMGESFLTRGAFDGGNVQVANADERPADVPQKSTTSPIKLASLVKTGEVPFPLLDPLAPVRLEIWYGQQQVPVELRDGRAFVPEPLDHQDVRFVLKHNGPENETFGVVLKVNGENTLYRQRRPAVDCSKWIMYPESTPTVVRGFQETKDEMRPFRVLSQAESKQNEMRYGKDTGQISFTVFRESSAPIAPPVLIDQDAEDLVAMMRGAYPPQPAENLAALKLQLVAAVRGQRPGQPELTRGLIVDSDSIEEHGTRIVEFHPDPSPVMSATITYYTPQD